MQPMHTVCTRPCMAFLPELTLASDAVPPSCHDLVLTRVRDHQHQHHHKVLTGVLQRFGLVSLTNSERRDVLQISRNPVILQACVSKLTEMQASFDRLEPRRTGAKTLLKAANQTRTQVVIGGCRQCRGQQHVGSSIGKWSNV